MKKTKFLSILGFIILLIIGYYQFGWFTPYNWFTAKLDLANGEIKLVEYGELDIYFQEKSKVAERLGIEIYNVGCNVSVPLINGINSYNHEVKQYLDEKLGINWKSKFDSLSKQKIEFTNFDIKAHGIAIFTDTAFLRQISSDAESAFIPSKREVYDAYLLLMMVVEEGRKNNIHLNEALRVGPLNGYYQQFKGYVNNEGDKIIWIHAFCKGLAPVPLQELKTSFQIVEDGGACFFEIRINLDKRTYFDFWINGIA